MHLLILECKTKNTNKIQGMNDPTPFTKHDQKTHNTSPAFQQIQFCSNLICVVRHHAMVERKLGQESGNLGTFSGSVTY